MRAAQVIALATLGSGCNLILGIKDLPLRPDGGARGDAGASSSRYREAVLEDSPILYLRFGERTGSTIHSEVGDLVGTYPPAGVTLGTVGALLDDPDPAITFDGTRTIQLPPAADFSRSEAFSAELWLRVARLTGDYAFIIDHETFDPARGGWDLEIEGASQTLRFERWADGLNGGTSVAPSIVDGAWHHVVAGFDGAATHTMALWIDGHAMNPITNSLDIPAVPAGWAVGGPNCPCTNNRLEGSIDELAIYPRLIPLDRILAHFNAATMR